MSDSTKSPAVPTMTSGIATLDELFQPYNRADQPGLVVAIASHGTTVYRRGFGLASVELGVANGPWTRMRIGSTSKHFTCLAALLLAEDGLLDLDADASDVIPELVVDGKAPTLRQFMNHTSGLRCGLDAGFLSEGMAIRPVGSSLAGQVRMRDVNFAPGTKFMYNNGAYHLLSLAIARAADMSFERFISERILAPLGMIDSLPVRSDLEIHRGMATLHLPQPGGGYRRGIFPSQELLGEGSIVSTVDDMLRWLAHLRGPKKIGNEVTWAQMIAPTRLSNGVTVPYGYGLMRHDYRGVEVIHHAGAVIGGACQMLTVPSHALDIIIMTNGAGVMPNELAKQVIDVMLGDALPEPREPKPATADYQFLIGKRYIGRESGLVIGFGDAGGTFGLSLLNLPPMPMAGGNGQLRLPFEDVAAGPFLLDCSALAPGMAPPETIEFADAGVLEPYDLLTVPDGGLSAVADTLVGCYKAPDLDARATIGWEDEHLMMRVYGSFGQTAMRLEVIGADLLGWQMEAADIPLRGIARIQRDAAGRFERLLIDTTRTRHMAFTRQ